MTITLEQLNTCLAGRYGIEREVGRGGMATVFLARDTRHNRRVALKVLHPELTQAIGPDRFLREIVIAAGLQHPHILPLYDSGNAEGMLFYVMPYVEGESLKEKLDREKQLAIEEAIDIAREVADALSYAHGRGVVHRDIKPGNILIDANHAVVSDFGVALILRAAVHSRLTDSGLSIGTPGYMSPEQATAERQIDGRSDIYSLGCVLYEMLTGDPPFTGASTQAILAKKLLQPVPSMRVVRSSIPSSLDHVTLKALSKTPADRFRTGADFARALQAAAHDLRGGTPGQARSADHVAPVVWDAPAGLTGGDAWPSGGPFSALSFPRLLGIVTAVLLLLSVIGFLTTAVYDVKMELPPEYTPSRWDFPIVGVRALIPVMIFMFPVLIVYVVSKYVLRLLIATLRAVAPMRRALDGVHTRVATTRNRVAKSLEPRTVAELVFIGFTLVSVAILSRYAPLLVSLSTSTSDTTMLSTPFRSFHHEYTIVLTVLIAALAVGWRRLSLYLRERRASGGRVLLARAGGLAWILAVLLMVTMPWMLLWSNERPRALLDGDRAYILIERDGDLVIYNADQRETLRFHADSIPSLVRLNIDTYVFESADAFSR